MTRNGRGRYVILDMDDYEQPEAEKYFMHLVHEGEKSISAGKLCSTNQVREMFGLNGHE